MTKPAAKANEKKPDGAGVLAAVESVLPDLEAAVEELGDRFDLLEFDRLESLLTKEEGVAAVRELAIEPVADDGPPSAADRIEAAAHAMAAICDRMDSIVDRLTL